MKIQMVAKFGIIILLTLSMTFQIVQSLAATQPMPVGLKLLRGDTQKIYFQIQTLRDKNDQTCRFSLGGLDPLIVNFDETTVTIEAGDIMNIYGTITVPQNVEFKTYNGKLSVSCSPDIELEDTTGSVVHQTMTLDFSVDVVQSLEEKQVPSVPAEEEIKIPYFATFIIIIIVLLVAGVGYWFTKTLTKKKRKK